MSAKGLSIDLVRGCPKSPKFSFWTVEGGKTFLKIAYLWGKSVR